MSCRKAMSSISLANLVHRYKKTDFSTVMYGSWFFTLSGAVVPE